MSRNTRLKAKAKIFDSLTNQLKENPVEFERDWKRYNYLKSTVFFIFICWFFQDLLKGFLLGEYKFLINWILDYQVFSTLSIVIFGVCLYLFKKLSHYYYGLMEIAFACALIFVSVSQLISTGLLGMFSLGTATYVLVRGIDNLVIGFSSPRVTSTENVKSNKNEETQ